MDNQMEAGTPPPFQPDEPPRPLPSLPIEILQRIIQFALPRLSFKTFRERYDILLTRCRVNKLWAAMAQEEFYSHVWLIHEVAASAFLAHHSYLLAGGNTSFRLNEAEQQSALSGVTTNLMQSLMTVLPTLRDLNFATKPGSLMVHLKVDLGALSRSSQDLETLVLDYCRITPKPIPAPLHLPCFRHLALSLLVKLPDVARILQTAYLPQLESLVLIHGES